MKKLLLLLAIVSISYTINAQTSKTVQVTEAGTLQSLFSQDEMDNVTDLTITGNLDARDFKFMRDRVKKLENLNIEETKILEYVGDRGTLPSVGTYPTDEIPKYAFFNSTTSIGKELLNLVVFPKNITSVGVHAFQNVGIKHLDFPNTLKSISDWSFTFCYDLETITFPNSLEVIGDYAFGDSKLVREIVIPNGVKIIGNGSFNGNYGLETIIIGSSVEKIGNSAFGSCHNLKSVVIGSSVETIGYAAFGYNPKLEEIYSLNNTPPTLQENIFYSSPLKAIYVPLSSVVDYKNALRWDAYYDIINPIPSEGTTYTITINNNGGGVVKEGDQNVNSVIVNEGENITLTIDPLDGYEITSLTYDGVDVLSDMNGNQYTIPNVNADAVLEVVFQKIKYELTVESAENGVSVWFAYKGDTPSLKFIASSGWDLDKVLYNNVDVTSQLVDEVFNVPEITADALLNVSFISASLADESFDAPEVSVYGTDSGFVVDGLPFGDDVQIYNASGKLINSATSYDKRMIIKADKNKIYIIKTPYKSYKMYLN